MYFQFARAIFFSDDKVEAAKNFIKEMIETNPSYDLSYKEGYGPYNLTELRKAETRKNQQRLITKRNILKGGRNIYPFYCILFSGLYNIGQMI